MNGATAEPGGTAHSGRRKRWLPASALEFVGCVECPMTLAEYQALPDEKVELFDLETARAWRVAEGPEETHEHPLVMFRKFVVRVEMVRGAPIMFGGAAGLRLLDADRELVRVMHPDEVVFLDPAGLDRIGSQYGWATDQEHPDVVLEVDDTTDVRRNKLLVYADRGFPEVWVEVPDVYSPSRPRGQRPGLTIYLLEAGDYRESGESRAFPSLTAEEAHRVLNERTPSPEMVAVASRVGRELGRREGTDPDDDPLLREQRAEARAKERAAMAGEWLRRRGFAVSSAFPADLPAADRTVLARASRTAVAAAAFTAGSVDDFLNRLRNTEES